LYRSRATLGGKSASSARKATGSGGAAALGSVPGRRGRAEHAVKLLYQTHSPFARKALVFAHEVGIADRIEVIHQETSPTRRNETVFAENPLGKVPVLLRPGLAAIFDSDVICAYLDTLHQGPKLIPPDGEARWRALRLQALAQGLADAGVALRWETVRRPEGLRYPPLRDGYTEKLVCAYDWLESELDVCAPIHVGHVALACCLSWLEFRELPAFRARRPRLSAWLEKFQARPSMRATPLSGETHD
jgi:glutathione S-transferase